MFFKKSLKTTKFKYFYLFYNLNNFFEEYKKYMFCYKMCWFCKSINLVCSLSEVGVTSSNSHGNVFLEVSHVGVQVSDQIRYGLSVTISCGSSLLIFISSLLAFSSSVISLLGLGNMSGSVVILWWVSGG